MPSGCSTPAQFSINNGKLQLDFPPFVSPCSGNSADYKIFTTAGETYTVSMKMERGVATDVIAIETRDHINNTVIQTAVWGTNIQPGVMQPCIEFTFTATSSETRLKIFSRSDGFTDPTVLYIDSMEILAYEHFVADVVSFSDYFPYGMQMPNRNGNVDSYRYGYNSQEKDNEISGSGNSYTAPFWQYDGRLGRRWNRDPKPNPAISDYACFAGNPILYSDPLGDTIIPFWHFSFGIIKWDNVFEIKSGMTLLRTMNSMSNSSKIFGQVMRILNSSEKHFGTYASGAPDNAAGVFSSTGKDGTRENPYLIRFKYTLKSWESKSTVFEEYYHAAHFLFFGEEFKGNNFLLTEVESKFAKVLSGFVDQREGVVSPEMWLEDKLSEAQLLDKLKEGS